MSQHGGNLAEISREYGVDPEKLVDYSANINWLGPPEEIEQVIRDSIDGIVNYPDHQYYKFREAVGKKVGVKVENIIAGNGAVELIYLLAKVLAPKQALVLAPTFSEYAQAVKSVGGSVERYYLDAEDDFQIEVSDLAAKFEAVDLFFLCNPNNPTGTVLNRKQAIKLVEAARKQDTFLVVDEAFVDFTTEEITVADLVTKYPNLFVLRSMTKFYSIPGLRLGYGVGSKELISRLGEAKDPWNVNFLAQKVGEQAVKLEDYQLKTLKAISKEREHFCEQLQEIFAFKVYYPKANYILIELTNTSYTAPKLKKDLLPEGFLIRDCSNFPGLDENYIRLAVKEREDNLRLVEVLESLVISR